MTNPATPWAPPDERAAIAIHEAGHAVIMIRCGMPFRYITLASRTAGSVAHVKTPDREVKCSAWDFMAAAAAGPIAHDIISDCHDRVFVAEGGGSDFEELLDGARYTLGEFRRGAKSERGLTRESPVRQIAAVAWADTYRRVAADWGGILATADALLWSHRALTRAAVRQIIDSAAPVDPPPLAHRAEEFWPPKFTGAKWWRPEGRSVARSAA